MEYNNLFVAFLLLIREVPGTTLCRKPATTIDVLYDSSEFLQASAGIIPKFGKC
jgi:hypothetical protein